MALNLSAFENKTRETQTSSDLNFSAFGGTVKKRPHKVPPMQRGTPFAATKTGIAVNTVLGLPGAALDVLREIPRGIAGTAAQGAALVSDIPQEEIKLTPKTKFEKAIFGNRPIQPAQEGAELLKIFGVKDNTALKYGPVLYAGLTLSDFVSVPGKKKALVEGIKTVDNIKGARRMLLDAGLADDVITAGKLDRRAVTANTDEAVATLIKEIEDITTAAKQIPISKGSAVRQVADDVPVTPRRVIDQMPVTPRRVIDEIPVTPRQVDLPSVPVRAAQQTIAEPTFIKQVEDVVPEIVNKKVSPEVLSTVAKNSLENQPTGIRPKSIDSQIKTIANTDRVVEIRVIEDGTIDIVDGRHLLEAARRYGVNDIKIKDVTLDYFPQGVPVRKTKKLVQSQDEIISGALAKYKTQAQGPVPPVAKLAEEAAVPRTPGGLKKLTGELLTPIASRLGRINPKLKTILRKLEFEVGQNTLKDNRKILPLLNATKKMSPTDRRIFDLARKNGDTQVENALAAKYGIEDAVKAKNEVLADILKRGNEVGMEIPERAGYNPRIVKNPEKYMAYLRSDPNWSQIRAMVEKHAVDHGKHYNDLTDEEIAGIVNNYIRGYGDKVALASPSFKKPRSIDVIDETLDEFYESSDSALSTYIIRMNDEIAGRKFFGKQLDAAKKPLNTEDSIGAWVMKLIADGELDPRFEKEVGDILKSRFHRGQMNGALDVYRNLEYMSTMGSPISAVTQIGDLAWSIYDNGIYHTLKGMTKKTGRVTKEDLGIEQITQEFATNTKTGKALDKVFKVVGLEKMDRLGKETLVNAEMSKFVSQAKKQSPELMNILRQTFDEDEIPGVLKAFADRKITPETKLVLFNKLLDFQPVAKSEMPQVYLEHPNGRIFYMLKSFTLKQIDIFRREALDQIVSGNVKQKAQGMKNLVLLGSAFAFMNATADEIKDTILGRETSLSDRVVDNLWRVAGASKYDVYKARQEGVGTTLIRKILPPISIADRSYKDVLNTIEGKTYEKGPNAGERYQIESTQTIPVGGKLFYWWFGRGSQKQEQTGESTSGIDLGIDLNLQDVDIDTEIDLKGIDIGDIGI